MPTWKSAAIERAIDERDLDFVKLRIAFAIVAAGGTPSF